jgi:ATP-dependent DNA helicase PIF1
VSLLKIRVPSSNDRALERLRTMNYAFLTGGAGSGKTYCIAQLISKNKRWGVLTATTGPAASNLAEKTGVRVKTFNAELHCGKELEDLQEASRTGELRKRLAALLTSGYERLIIDEASMLRAEAFSILYCACRDSGMGLVLVGDFLQLRPIGKKGEPDPRWAFESEDWNEFTRNGANIIRLTENHRQGNGDTFTAFLNLLRAGRGVEAEAMLPYLDIHWNRTPFFVDEAFLGMTLVWENFYFNAINEKAARGCPGYPVTYATKKFGERDEDWNTDWDKRVSPSLRVNNKVMILKNQYKGAGETRELYCANGDVGEVTALLPEEVTVRLDNGRTVEVGYVQEDNSWWETIRNKYDGTTTKKKHEATCGVRYMPLALGYAATVHKAQGLTLPRVQVCTDLMVSYGRPGAALLYVALSRVRESSDIYLTGTVSLSDACCTAPEVAEWI